MSDVTTKQKPSESTGSKQPKVRKCPASIRNIDTGADQPCPQILLPGMLCPNRTNHVMPHPTGFCDRTKQQCEGKQPVSPSGKPMKTCAFWLTCPCMCHTRITRMFALSDEPRRLIDNPKYVPPEHHVIMPTPEEVALLKAQRQQERTPATVIESDRDDIPATVLRQYRHDSGTNRAGRGELEQNVRQACDYWVKTEPDEDCDTKWIAEWCYENLGIQPSRGAIGAVFDRWKALGFAMFFKSPIRFVCYTPEGIQFGLEGLKERAKQSHNQKINLQKRGIK